MIAPDIFKKLRLNDSQNILIVNAPKEYVDFLGGLNYDSTLTKEMEGKYDFVQVFATSQEELEKMVVAVARAGKYDCLFWACYPKGTGNIKSDIKRDTVWTAFTLIDMNPVSQVSIDETWSALRARPTATYKKST